MNRTGTNKGGRGKVGREREMRVEEGREKRVVKVRVGEKKSRAVDKSHPVLDRYPDDPLSCFPLPFSHFPTSPDGPAGHPTLALVGSKPRLSTK